MCISHNLAEAVAPILTCSQPCAVFCVSDNIARELYQIVKKAGRRIPDDVSVVGAGNLDFGELLAPPLTSIDQHPFEIGTQAVTLIFKRLQEKVSADAGPLHVSVKGRLVPRDSVRRLSAAGKTAR